MGHFYIPFASKLFELGHGSYDVAVVSHAGHSPGYYRPTEGGGNDWYSLEDQVAHKMAYLREHASGKDTLYLVGHSIGCYVISGGVARGGREAIAPPAALKTGAPKYS